MPYLRVEPWFGLDGQEQWMMASLQLARTRNRMDYMWLLAFHHSWLVKQPGYGMVVLRRYLCKAVKDIDEKKHFLDIIKLVVAL
jgi:hypothetical protein